jgi:hypothetical protein
MVSFLQRKVVNAWCTPSSSCCRKTPKQVHKRKRPKQKPATLGPRWRLGSILGIIFYKERALNTPDILHWILWSADPTRLAQYCCAESYALGKMLFNVHPVTGVISYTYLHHYIFSIPTYIFIILLMDMDTLLFSS